MTKKTDTPNEENIVVAKKRGRKSKKELEENQKNIDKQEIQQTENICVKIEDNEITNDNLNQLF